MRKTMSQRVYTSPLQMFLELQNNGYYYNINLLQNTEKPRDDLCDAWWKAHMKLSHKLKDIVFLPLSTNETQFMLASLTCKTLA
jgi:hypothetical protein